MTFFPVPPVKPIAYPRQEPPAEDKKPVARSLTQSHVGQNLDLKV